MASLPKKIRFPSLQYNSRFYHSIVNIKATEQILPKTTPPKIAFEIAVFVFVISLFYYILPFLLLL